VAGEVRPRAAAREAFEQALIDGRTAALLQEERTSLFTQEIGNIPPHTDVVAQVVVDHPVAWLTDGSWEYRFPTVVTPRYLGAPGRIDDAARVSVPVAEGDLPARVTLALRVGDTLASGGQPTSPSHMVRAEARDGELAVSFADGAGAPLDRDVVVRWPVATPDPGVMVETARPSDGHPMAGSAFGLLTIVPPEPAAHTRSIPRDLIVLLDTSGSMSGEPLAQARVLVEAVVHSLTDQDRLELIAFSNQVHRWRPQPVDATPDARAAARTWLAHLEAGGGTEMTHAIREALGPLRAEAQRQVLLVTDGLVGFEHEIVWHVLNCLPRRSRLHAVGVGPSVNRALTATVARAGRGAEVVLASNEPADAAAKRLVARTRAPMAVNVEVSGSALQEVAPVRLPDVLLGAPCTVALRLHPGGGDLVVRADLASGPAWQERLTLPAMEPGMGRAAVVARYGREAVADAEMRIASGVTSPGDTDIEHLGLAFAISTRLTSWIAVTGEATVDTTQPTRRIEVAHAVPAGLSVLGLGLRGASKAGAPEFTQLHTHTLNLPMRFSLGASRPLLGRVRSRLASAKRHFSGRLTSLSPTRMVVEFEVRDAALIWDPDTVTVVLDHRGTVPATVSSHGTTAPGRIKLGQSVRLVVEFDQTIAGKPRKVMVVIGGTVLAIEIEDR
jgi:Ca-activated chloride channel family protein